METTTRNVGIEFMSLVALGFIAIIYYIRHSLKKNTTSHEYPLPPGPKGYPIIGCLPEMIKNKPASKWIHNLMRELNTEIACIRLGNALVIPVTSPALAREFMKKHDVDSSSRPNVMSTRVITRGYKAVIFSPWGDQWKKMRKVVVSEVIPPAMHQFLHERRRKEADHIVHWVHNRCKKGLTIDLKEVTQHYCGNLIRRMLFNKRFFGAGREDGGPGAEERAHVDGVFTIILHNYGFAIADYAPWLEYLDLDGYKKTLVKAYEGLTKSQDLVIKKRVEMRQKETREKKEDVLDVLINLKDSKSKPLLSLEEIQALAADLSIAAIDNPSTAVEWAMAEMMNQPHIMDKAIEELDKVVGKERLVQESDMPQLTYLKACLRESFRLHPLSHFNVPHQTTKDMVVGGYFIPEGSHVVISRPGLGRNPKVWDDPLEFKPERHIKNDNSDIVFSDPELNIFSFSTGRRGCPGIVLGSTMTTILLARLIQGFTWCPPPGVTKICLDEPAYDGSLAKPLIAQATPRLDSKVYLQLTNN